MNPTDDKVRLPLETALIALPPHDPPDEGTLLSRILKAIRRRRGLLVAEVAARMNMAPRTYQLFEAGGGNLNLTRIERFAEATNSDAWAILTSLALGKPDFALQCADNKLMTATMETVRDFQRVWSADIERLDARVVMFELDGTWDRLGAIARSRQYPPRD